MLAVLITREDQSKLEYGSDHPHSGGFPASGWQSGTDPSYWPAAKLPGTRNEAFVGLGATQGE